MIQFSDLERRIKKVTSDQVLIVIELVSLMAVVICPILVYVLVNK